MKARLLLFDFRRILSFHSLLLLIIALSVALISSCVLFTCIYNWKRGTFGEGNCCQTGTGKIPGKKE